MISTFPAYDYRAVMEFKSLSIRVCRTVGDIHGVKYVLQEKVRYIMDTLRDGIHVDNSC